MDEDLQREASVRPVSGSLAHCVLHDLHFDPSKSAGCVLCRRDGSVHAGGRGKVTPLVWGGAFGLIVLLAGSAVALRRHATNASTSETTPAPNPGLSGAVAPGGGLPRLDPRRMGAQGALAEPAAREALQRITTERAACLDGSTESCVRYATACSPFDSAPGFAGTLKVAVPEVAGELRDACRGAANRLRQQCDGGSLAACDAALNSVWGVSASRPSLEHACDLGSVRGCRRLAQHISGDSVGGEAANLRADALEKCGADHLLGCEAPSRDELNAQALAQLKEKALERCHAGTADDCSRYADRYPGDLAFSAQLIQEGCNKGAAAACDRLADILAQGRGLRQDPRRALELRDRGTAELQEALSNCEGPACGLVQYSFATADGDRMEQLRRAQLAPDEVAKECDAGKLGACEGLRAAYSGGASRLSEDRGKASAFGARANQLLERQCRSADRDACKNLAQNLLYSLPKDVLRGQRLADEACTRGGYLDCWMLGDFFRHDGASDAAAATSYYGRAVAAALPRCDAADASACELLARAYGRGRGVVQDEDKFAEYTRRYAALARSK